MVCALMKNPDGLLGEPEGNTQVARYMIDSDLEKIREQKSTKPMWWKRS